MTDKKRWKEMDILRGMAILMVMLYHSIIVFPTNLHDIFWCRTLHTFLWTVQMPLFFLVSGFCYSFHGGYGSYAMKKCRRILIPHIVFSALDILPRLIPNPLVREQMGAGEAIKDFLLYGGSDWFLWTLFVIVMAFPALERLLTGGPVMRRIGILIPAVLFLLKPFMPDLLLLNMASQYLWYYFLGYGLRRKTEAVGVIMNKRKALLSALAGMLIFFAGTLIWEKTTGTALVSELLCVLFSFWFFSVLAGMCRGRAADFLVSCGTWSLQMYLLDAYALVLTRTLLVSVLGIESAVLIIMGNFLADTFLVLLISKYILTKAKVFRMACGIPEKG